MKKVKWEDVLPLRQEHCGSKYGGGTIETEEDKIRNKMREECLASLRQAEQEGKVALNPPDVEEIASIIHANILVDGNKSNSFTVAQKISDRIRKGE